MKLLSERENELFGSEVYIAWDSSIASPKVA